MSRFSSLEFENHEQDGSAASIAGGKDEAFYLSEAHEAFLEGRFDAALRAYSKVLEFNSKNAIAWAGQVRMLIEMGEFPEAKLWADKGLEKLPDAAELLAAKAVALARIGDTQGALAFSDAAMQQKGESAYVWISRGDVFLARGETRADFCFQKAVGLEPANWFTHWLIGRVHAFYQKFSLALKYAQQALNLNPGLSSVWLLVGQCQLELGLATKAENSFEQAKQLNPRCEMVKQEMDKLSDVGLWTKLWRRLFSK